MSRELRGWAAVSWAPHSRRSEMFARELQGRLHCIHYLRFQSPLHAPLKYLLQTMRTLQILFRERPAAVHVQNPPFVCGLVVDAYCRRSGARFVIEHHSAAFDPIWNWALPFQRYITRRATTNLVTSTRWAEVMRSWGARSLVMHDPFLDLPEGTPFETGPGFSVAFVSTFAPDEPLQEVLAAARMLPEVHFFITGDTRRLSAAVRSDRPENVTFTGFLDPNREYLGLLRAADAVMVLTTRDHTLQLGGCEAIAVGKPLITSDWPYLRDLFAGGTVFVAPEATSIRDGVRQAVRCHDALRAEIGPYRAARRREWAVRLAHLKDLVTDGRPATTAAPGGMGRAGPGRDPAARRKPA